MNTDEHSEPIPLLTRDTCKIAMNQAKYLVENGEAANEDKLYLGGKFHFDSLAVVK